MCRIRGFFLCSFDGRFGFAYSRAKGQGWSKSFLTHPACFAKICTAGTSVPSATSASVPNGIALLLFFMPVCQMSNSFDTDY